MPRNKNQDVNVNYSNVTTTPNGATTEQLQMIDALSTNSLTDYKLRNLRVVISDKLNDLNDTIHEEVSDTHVRDVLFEKSETLHALFSILYDILPQMPDYFERVNMALSKYESILNNRK